MVRQRRRVRLPRLEVQPGEQRLVWGLVGAGWMLLHVLGILHGTAFWAW